MRWTQAQATAEAHERLVVAHEYVAQERCVEWYLSLGDVCVSVVVVVVKSTSSCLGLGGGRHLKHP